MGLKVLIVDESHDLNQAFQIALGGADLQFASSDEQALKVLKHFKPDIIFIDLLVQKLGGYKFCQRLKSDPQNNSTPMILMNSQFVKIDNAAYMHSQANGTLDKPFDIPVLHELVKNLLPHISLNFAVPSAPNTFSNISPPAQAQKPNTAAPVQPGEQPPPFLESDEDQWSQKSLPKDTLTNISPPFKKSDLSTNNVQGEKRKESAFEFAQSEKNEKEDTVIPSLNKDNIDTAKTTETKEPQWDWGSVTSYTNTESTSPTPEVKTTQSPSHQSTPANSGDTPMSESEIRALVEQEIKKAVKEIVPEIATKMIATEIRRLLSGQDSQK